MAKRPQSQPRQTTTTVRTLLGGKLRLLRHNANPMLYGRAFVQGKYITKRTGETSVLRAQQIAEEWYFDVRKRTDAGELLHEPTFADVVKDFIADPTLKHEVSEGQHANYEKKWNVLSSHFDPKKIRPSQIDDAFLEQLRLKRAEQKTRYNTPLTPNTISKDLIFVRQVLRWAKDKKKLPLTVPSMPSFSKGRFRIKKRGRPRLDGKQWKKLTNLARTNANNALKLASASRRGRQANPDRLRELYWFMLLCVGGALRTGEAYSIRWRDCKTASFLDANGEQTEAIHAKVLGKHSRGGEREDAFILYGGEIAFRQMKEQRKGVEPNDKLFRYNHESSFRDLLKSADLYVDPESGMTRNTKSLRPTGICLRLENNPHAPLRDVARWARTSLVILEKFYDQVHPHASAARIAGFKSAVKKTPKN